MKLAWLIVNKFIFSESLSSIIELFKTSAKKLDINLVLYNNIEIIDIMSKKNYLKPDFVLFWDKDIKLASFMENEGLCLYNNSEAIRLCDDKSLTYLKLKNENISQPKTIFSPLIYYNDLSKDKEFIDTIERNFNYPFVFKECFGSFGNQVYLINDRNELVEKIKNSNVDPFIIQEFIETSFGRDLRVYVVGDKIIGTMHRKNTSGDFRANIENGGVGEKYFINEKQKEIVLKVVKVLKLNFAGVDLLFGKNDEPILCEVNSNAFFKNLNKVLDVNIEDEILKHIIQKL